MKTVIALVMMCYALGSLAKDDKRPTHLSDKMLDELVVGLRKMLPMTGPDGTRMLSVSRQGRTLIYGIYALDSMNQAEIDSTFRATKFIICRQEAEKFYLTKGVNLTWNYFDRSGKYLATMSVTPSDCGY